jgi:hypothetical protein
MNDYRPSMPEPPGAPGLPGSANPPKNLALALLWILLLTIVGGAVCAWSFKELGSLGGLSVWAVGALGGFVTRKIRGAACLTVAWLLVAVCLLMLLIGEVSYLHWKEGTESWGKAISLLPKFVREMKLDALIDSLFTVFGAVSAYQQAGRRYRLVAIEDR